MQGQKRDWTGAGGCGIINHGFLRACDGIGRHARFRFSCFQRVGSSPFRRTSSGIPLTAALPAPSGRKAPPDGEFLRFHPRFAPLDSRVIFYGGRGKRLGGRLAGRPPFVLFMGVIGRSPARPSPAGPGAGWARCTGGSARPPPIGSSPLPAGPGSGTGRTPGG